MLLERAGGANKAVLGPNGGPPFPFFRDVGDRSEHQFAPSRKRLAPPTGQCRDLATDELIRSSAILGCTSLHEPSPSQENVPHPSARYRENGMTARRRSSRKNTPPQTSAPTTTGKTISKNECLTRTWLATAPPR